MTSSIGTGHSNLIDSATLSTPGDPWSNLAYMQNRALSLVARSASADAADTIVDIDHGSDRTAQVLYVAAHNGSSSGTFVLERGATQGSTSAYAGDELPMWPFTPLNGVYSGRHFGICAVMPTANSARWTRIRFINSTNPAGYFQLGRIFIGPAFFPAISPTELDADWQPSFGVMERTEFGTDWVDPRSPLRRANVVFGALTYEEGSELHEIKRLHETTGEVVYIAHRTDRARMQQYGFLATFQTLSKLKYPFHRHNGIALSFDERGGAPL